jgi:hypothetical protein
MQTRLRLVSQALLLSVLSLAACGPINVKCGTDGFTENSGDGQDYFWKDRGQLTFEFGDNVPQSLRDSIKSGADEYNKKFTNFTLSIGSHSAPQQSGTRNLVSGDGINGIYVVSESDWFFYDSNPGAVAVTNNLYSHDHILETDIFFLVKDNSIVARAPASVEPSFQVAKIASDALQLFDLRAQRAEHSDLFDLNGSLGMALTDETVRATGMAASDFPTVKAKAFSVHEFGHSLGRCHTTNPNSIMQPKIATSIYRTKPFLSEFDVGVLAEHYAIDQ